MTPIGLVVLGAGVILLWSGAKGYDVREVIQGAFTGNKPTKAGGATHDQEVANQPHPSATSTPGGGAGAALGQAVRAPQGPKPPAGQTPTGGPELAAGTANTEHPYIRNTRR